MGHETGVFDREEASELCARVLTELIVVLAESTWYVLIYIAHTVSISHHMQLRIRHQNLRCTLMYRCYLTGIQDRTFYVE